MFWPYGAKAMKRPVCFVSSSLTSAVVGQGVAVVTLLAVGAGRAVCVVQAPEALARPGVTRLGILHVDVAIAAAWLTLAAGLVWVAVVTRSASLAASAWLGETWSAREMKTISVHPTR